MQLYSDAVGTLALFHNKIMRFVTCRDWLTRNCLCSLCSRPIYNIVDQFLIMRFMFSRLSKTKSNCHQRARHSKDFAGSKRSQNLQSRLVNFVWKNGASKFAFDASISSGASTAEAARARVVALAQVSGA